MQRRPDPRAASRAIWSTSTSIVPEAWHSPIFICRPPAPSLAAPASRDHTGCTSRLAPLFEAFADPLSGEKHAARIAGTGRDGGAHQTLIPPSIADGEPREWEGEKSSRRSSMPQSWAAASPISRSVVLIRRYVSEHASERPAPDLPHLLYEADPILGRAGYRWLGMPDPDAPRVDTKG